MDANRVRGSLFGMALGDAIGAETEFLNMDGIRRRFPPNGPTEPPGNPALVTDDTQMALAVGEALVATPRPFTPQALGEQLKRTFVAWYDDPDNNRAPGNTCLTSVEHLMDGQPWHQATDISSKGCGANMRVMPVGVLDVDATTRAALAQFQAAYTHAHPTGLAAADLTAYVITDLGNGGDVNGLRQRTRDYAESQRRVYHADWLGDLWQRAIMMPSAEDYIAHGWDECLSVLDRVDTAMANLDRDANPCEITGAGWIAEEAFATAFLCFLMFPDDPARVIWRGAYSSGDSDSIACIAGAFAGAYHGVERWNPDWIRRIEYRDRIQALSDALLTKDVV